LKYVFSNQIRGSWFVLCSSEDFNNSSMTFVRCII
jgi:hypothetical protein